jgi:hypothetical protein
MTTARPVPMLTRELEGRGTQHVRLLIPIGIKGLSENDRVTLQSWLELVDWTGRMMMIPFMCSCRNNK